MGLLGHFEVEEELGDTILVFKNFEGVQLAGTSPTSSPRYVRGISNLMRDVPEFLL
jgi:hypothetical protein